MKNIVKFLNTLFLAVLLLHSTLPVESATAETTQRLQLSDASFLRKLSFHLRGVQPSDDEYSELSAIQPGQRPSFFDKKIDQYLASPHYQERMMFRLSELFQLKTPIAPPLTGGFGPNNNFQTNGDALLDLFKRMARDNLSWDTLLTGKDYYAGDLGDIQAFQPIMTSLTEEAIQGPGKPPIAVHFEASDQRIAGALTTARFLSRYATTNINKNRRRAAAVFRIFYCDPMSPVVPPPKDRKAAVLDQAFGTPIDHSKVTEKDLKNGITISDVARHGAQTQCAACHYKLDPLGKTFQNFGVTLNSEPAAGALVFARPGAQKVDIPVKGIGELGAEIVKTPEYTACQVEWFWQQLIGQDVFLLPSRKDELQSEFDRLGRRTNDFVRILVKAPEFREKPRKIEILTQQHVSPLLKRCDSCHNALETIAPFAATPLQLIEPELLERMRARINLPDDNRQKMPRDWTRWNTRDLELLKRWLNDGAVDSSGKPQISVMTSQGEQGASK